MLKNNFLLSILLIFCLFIPVLAQSQNSNQNEIEEPIIKVNTDLVSFDVQVLNKKTNNPIKGLTEKDFTIYEDNVKQEITNFNQDLLPLSVLLLMDVSGSTQPINHEIQQATKQALELLKPKDEVSLMAFAAGTGSLDLFTTNKQTIIDNMEKVRLKTINTGQGTNFTDAIKTSITHMNKFSNPNYRKVVIVITDNIVAKPLNSEKQEIIKNLLENNITVSCLVVEDPQRSVPVLGASCPSPSQQRLSNRTATPNFDSFRGGEGPQRPQRPGKGNSNINTTTNRPPSTSRNLPAGTVLPPSLPFAADKIDAYVNETGGELFDARRASILEKFVELVDHLRARYSVGYFSSNTKTDGKIRKIKIKVLSTGLEWAVDKDDLVVKSRRGYFPTVQQ